MRSDRVGIVAWLLLLLFAAAVPPASRAEEDTLRVAVVVGRRAAPFEGILEGFRRRMTATGLRPVYTYVELDGDAEAGKRALREAVRSGPDLVFALGSAGVEAACREAPEIPVVAGGILRPEAIPKGSNATGVYLEHSPEVQLRWLRSVLPAARVAGILYNPEENRARVEAYAAAAREVGLRIEARPVASPREIPAALDTLSRRVDVLFSVYDGIATTSETARELMRTSFRQRVPLAGLSAAWVKAGALCALDWDYDDVGSQCADAAIQILKGRKPSALAPVPPRRAVHALNLNSARRLGIRLSDAAIHNASIFPGRD
jgi:putative ABC transport system substrate-binding protein